MRPQELASTAWAAAALSQRGAAAQQLLATVNKIAEPRPLVWSVATCKETHISVAGCKRKIGAGSVKMRAPHRETNGRGQALDPGAPALGEPHLGQWSPGNKWPSTTLGGPRELHFVLPGRSPASREHRTIKAVPLMGEGKFPTPANGTHCLQ